jgi:hypothetical protein
VYEPAVVVNVNRMPDLFQKDDPWSQAEVSLLGDDEEARPVGSAPEEVVSVKSSLRLVVLKVSVVLEALAGLILVVYGLDVSQNILLSLGGYLIIRSILITTGRCGIWVSGLTSPILGGIEFILAMLTVRDDVRGSLETYHVSLPLLLVLFIWECVRYQLLQFEYQARVVQDEEEATPTRPWWWREQMGATEAGLPRWVTRRNDPDPREDDGSVDFASVQSEWATKSEQDPLWWSRDHE